MAKKKAINYRKFVKSKTTDELYQKYFQERSADQLSRGLVQARGSAAQSYRQASEILKTLRFHEYYIQELQKEHKQELEKIQKEVRKLTAQVKKLTRENKKLQEQQTTKEGGKTFEKSTENNKQKEKVLNVVKSVEAFHNKKQEEAKARARGESHGEAEAKNTTTSGDKYGQILAAIEKYRKVTMHEKRRDSLRSSPEFRQRFQERFADLSPDELNKLWEDNFGEGSVVYKSVEGSSSKNVSWSYSPKRKK